MKITLLGIDDERLIRPLQLIADLFFEECEVRLTTNEADEVPDYTIKIDLNQKLTKFLVSVSLRNLCTGITYTETSQRTWPNPDENEKEAFKLIKREISRCFLLTLQHETGIIQKWGFLTGIRPTKLLHKEVQMGTPKEIAHQKLKDEYMIHTEKIDLMQQIVERQLEMVPDLYDLKNEVSIYIGIPFCPTKCAYCTFPAFAINGKQGKVDSFLGGLHYEMRKVGEWLKEKGICITTIYYGGGTPTSITAEEMDLLYEEMYNSFPSVEKVREITVEAGRPDTITPEKLEVLKKWKIDRISINPQSYTQETLKAIGRHHTVEETIDKFWLARKSGMKNINMDLIIGLPGEGTEELSHSLTETEKLMPESLTVHTLSFKRASEMTRHKNRYKVADRAEVEKMMDMASCWTIEHGYVPYYLYRQKNILGNLENVGYASPGQESIYNIMIMEEMQTIIGLGCGASSKFVHPQTGKITRFANPKDPKSYNEGYQHYTEEKIKMLDELFSEMPVIK
ncbi:oxygen-independent coproporphyrinogen-3 oxidase [Bacillus oleivorans]|uniref:Oxygen-independent coproporphyrinogen-3 oxidase n=1 Tax=Bacillus oleivorans TaxID=1448271 RepID=A0A285CSI0_9BACI|nr:coproporphyrinogen III oxidase [Bacillus oleivorans]SNX69998.1 oxygen-independent coproporphyrinogen-3 oxidase [Bacillus oleivorans]